MTADDNAPRTLIIVLTRIGCDRGSSILDEFITHWSIPGGEQTRNLDGWLFELEKVSYDLLLVHGHNGITDDGILGAISAAWDQSQRTRKQTNPYSSAVLFRHPPAAAKPLQKTIAIPDDIKKKMKITSDLEWATDYSSSQGGYDPTRGFLNKLNSFLEEKNILSPDSKTTLIRAIEDRCFKPIPQIIQGLHDIQNLLLALRLDLDLLMDKTNSEWQYAHAQFKQIQTILSRRAFEQYFKAQPESLYTLLTSVFLKNVAVSPLKCKLLWEKALPGNRKNWSALNSGAYVNDLRVLSQTVWNIMQGLENCTEDCI